MMMSRKRKRSSLLRLPYTLPGSMNRLLVLRPKPHALPVPTWSISERLLNGMIMPTLLMPEFFIFDSGKSISR